MTNLLQETLEAIALADMTPEDVVFIGSLISGHSCSWEEFTALADREYDAGYGRQEVAEDLTIVFRGGARLERREYDGSEWWELVRVTKTLEAKPLKTIFVGEKGGWCTLAELNEREET